MTESFRLGTVAGVRIGVNWSVLVIFGLIFLGLTTGVLPSSYPDASTVGYVVVGLVTALAFFASLLAHELSHALVARRNGVDVKGIVLWLFGGVAQLEGEPQTPGADLRIAGVGPLVSVVLGVFFGGVGLLLAGLGLGGLTIAALAYLAMINIVLAVFNLVPAAPLDGGRILRAFLWQRRGDRTSAAVTAARAGRVFGFLLIGLGVLQIVATGDLGGLWLALIGFFLVSAAAAEEQQAVVGDALSGVRVGDVMTADPDSVDGGLGLEAFVHTRVLVDRHSAYPLVDDDGRLTGLVSLQRLRAVPPERRAVQSVRDIACPPHEVPTASAEEPLTDLLPRMSGCTDGRAVVLDADGRVVGIVSPSDVARTLQLSRLQVEMPQRSGPPM